MTEQFFNPGNVTLHVFTDEQLRAYSMNLINEMLEAISPSKEVDVYLSVDETADLLKVSKPTLWRWEKSNYLVPVRAGRTPRYRRSDIQKLMEG